MFVKSTAILAFIALAARVVVATPPACVLGAANTEPDPSDFETLCASDKAKSYLTDNCGDNLEAAQSYFEDVCTAHDQTVTFDNNSNNNDDDNDDSGSSSTSSSTSSDTESDTEDDTSSTASASVTGTNTYGASGSSPSATGSDVAVSTGAAASLTVEMGMLGMGSLFAFGVMLAF